MNAPELRFGIVGTGVIAAFHAKAIAAASGGRLVGVSSRTLSTAQEFARQHGATFVARDAEELVASVQIDAAAPSEVALELENCRTGAGVGAVAGAASRAFS